MTSLVLGPLAVSQVEMSERQRLNYTRYRLISLGLAAALHDADDDLHLVAKVQRRSPSMWMSPYLRHRTDVTQRNTLAKLEMDFVEVSVSSS